MRIFRYKPTVTNLRVLLVLLWVAFVVIPVAFEYYPFNNQTELHLMVLLLLYSILPIIYWFYLIQVAQTAIFTLDERTIGYHDKYTRIVARWDEVIEYRRDQIRLENGRSILIKLGVKGLEDWQEFHKTVIEKAKLKPADAGCGQVPRWTRSPREVPHEQ